MICTNNPSSAKFSIVTSAVKHSPSTARVFETCAMQSSRTLASFDFPKRGRFMIKGLQPEEGWDIFWTLLAISKGLSIHNLSIEFNMNENRSREYEAVLY